MAAIISQVSLNLTWGETTTVTLTWARNGEKMQHVQKLDAEASTRLFNSLRPGRGNPVGSWLERIWQGAVQSIDLPEMLATVRRGPELDMVLLPSKRVVLKPEIKGG